MPHGCFRSTAFNRNTLVMKSNGILPLVMILVAAAALLLIAHPTLAKDAVIITDSGLRYEGTVISEDADNVRIRTTNGIVATVSRSSIDTFEYKKPIAEDFAERREALADDDLEGRYKLASDLVQKEAYQLAKTELEKMIKAFPDDNRLTQLLQIAIEREKLQDKAEQGPAIPKLPQRDRPGNANNPSTNAPNRPDRPRIRPGGLTGDLIGETKLLNDEQINIIKIWELPSDLSNAGVNIRIEQDDLNDLLKDYADHHNTPKGVNAQRAFRRAKGWEQLELIFALKARDYYEKVSIRGDPPALKKFRSGISRTYVSSYFRNTFGSGAIDNLYLFPVQGQPPEATYTNFYILSRYRGQGNAMIDRDRPDESLLLQWGLPRAAALYPAPDVPGWRPFFSGTDDPKFVSYVEWIRSLYPKPDYGINYTPPTFSASASASDTNDQTGTASGTNDTGAAGATEDATMP